jgi:hypothetical protein
LLVSGCSGSAWHIKLRLFWLACWWGWLVVGVGGVWWVGFWLLVENCIVDASIFVVKLCRANGGCLGTRSR